MEYTVDFAKSFLESAKNYSNICRSIEKECTDKIKNYKNERDKKIEMQIAKQKEGTSQYINEKKSALEYYDIAVSEIDKTEIPRRNNIYDNSIRQIIDSTSDFDLNNGINRIISELNGNSKEVSRKREEKQRECSYKLHQTDIMIQNETMDFFENILQFRKKAKLDCDKLIREAIIEKENALKNADNNFLLKYPPKDLKNEFMRIYNLEPDPYHYECAENIPPTIKIGNIVHNISDMKLSEHAKNIIMGHYHFLIHYTEDKSRNAILSIPYSLTFGQEFNYAFKFNKKSYNMITNRICAIAMRLFMLIPTGKINFTFLDPNLAQTFALFGRLVETDDRSNKVINGKIWSDEKDMQERLQILTEHISNITQRCLQGRYEDIREYNKFADQNAEPYQVLMIMDFPQNFNKKSLDLLKQISTTGPKCGVYVVILESQEQYYEICETDLEPLVDNILNGMTNFIVRENDIEFENELYCNNHINLDLLPLYSSEELNRIIPVLKEGIRTANRVIIPYDRMLENAQINHSTAEFIRIPIGVHGANEVQYFTLGTGGSQHALIAGMTGAGKSTLLHNIIFGLLNQYDPDELSIYLIDFKRGVEFKIYADHLLPAFKVIAIESEREFGYNVLASLEKEQQIRADRFNQFDLHQLSEYRKQHEKIPRILVIMDEFHELFSGENDELSIKSAEILERIVRQGRSFGVHLMLATQDYSNIRGLDPSVFKQMSVRIVLKCSDSDANMMLEDGASLVKQISTDDAGRAIYNSEAGNKSYNSHFRVAFIPPDEYNARLEKISSRTKKFMNPRYPTRVMLTNIENNKFSFFRQFPYYDAGSYSKLGHLFIGEALDLDNDINMIMQRKNYSNILMVGENTNMARSMFTFALLSICINYWIVNRHAPEKPIITLINAKPLYDSYFKDTIELLAEFLPAYIRYITNDDVKAIHKTVSYYFDATENDAEQPEDQYLFVFGYQRAEDLKSDDNILRTNDIDDDIFNITQSSKSKTMYSVKEMMINLMKLGAQKGIHTVIWQDSFDALYKENSGIIAYFSMRVAFEMSPEDYSRFIGYNESRSVGKNNAVFYSKARDNQKFKPYKLPNKNWLKKICGKLQ